MIQVIHRALDIVEFIAKDTTKEFGLGEISESLELNKGTCANIIKTLVNRGYLAQSGKKQGYKLGSGAYYLTGNYSNKKELLQVSREPMKEVQRKINECCILAIIKENKRYTLHKESSTQVLQVITNNEEKNVYLTATGRMILACMDTQEQELFIQKYGLPSEMWDGVEDKDDLIQELNKIKEKQLAIHYDGAHVVGVGAPIYKNGTVIASLGIYLPEVRFNYKLQELIFEEIGNTAKLISERIGMLPKKLDKEISSDQR
jgi:IclR family KDG regulon transcriptional repressor